MRERSFWAKVDLAVGMGYSVPSALVLLNESSTAPAAVLAIPGALLMGASIAGRRRHPLPWVIVLVLSTLGCQVFEPTAAAVPLVPLLLVLYCAAGQARFRCAVAALGGSITAAGVTALPDFRPGAAAVFVPSYLASWTFGLAANLRRRDEARRRAHERQLRQTDLERAELELARVRLDIAWELHDIVAHGISLITVQAAFGGLVVDTDPDSARSALNTIEVTGRRTLVELRQMLGVLRQPQGIGAAASISPAAGLSDLVPLLARFEAAGLTVNVDGHPPAGLNPTVELTAYRIVQEALTNVLRHADSNRATVTVRCDDDSGLRVVIRNGRSDSTTGRRAVPVGPGHGAGHGLLGMRERAASLGGQLTAGPVADGGFEVAAYLPSTEAPAGRR